MKQFTVEIKSHGEYPDFERVVEAKNFWEAAHMIMKEADVDFKEVVDNMRCDGVIKETSKDTLKRLEKEWSI